VVRLIGESQMVIPGGVNIDYFVSTTVGWIQAAVGFHAWLLDRLGLEAEVESVETIDSSLLNAPPTAEGVISEAKTDDAGKPDDGKPDEDESDDADEQDEDKPKD